MIPETLLRRHEIPDIDLLHGELKNLIYEIEGRIEEAKEATLERAYLVGIREGYLRIYQETYRISFRR